jgi:predicted ATPase
MALARELDHPETLVVAGHVAAQMHQQRGEAHLARVCAKEALDVAEEYGFSLWVTFGLIELGWAEAELGDAEGGIAKMRRGLAQYELTGAKLRCPYFLGLLADQLSKAGRLEEAFEVITKALTLAEHTGEGYALSELHLVKGELFLKVSERNQAGKLRNHSHLSTVLSQARDCFAMSLAVARQQGARSWELRAALSMYRLDLRMGNPNHMQLEKIYSSFTEGFEAADFKQARKLLDSVPLDNSSHVAPRIHEVTTANVL